MNRKILLQVAGPALLIGLLLVGACLVSAWSIHRLQTSLANILSENVASIQAARDLENQMRQLRYHSLLYLNKPSDDYLKQIKDDEQGFEEALARARTAANTPEEAAYLDQIESGYRQYHDEMARLRHEAAERGPRTDFKQLAETHPIRHIVRPCQDLWRVNHEQLERNAADSERLSRQARLALLLLGLGGPLGGLLCGYGIVRGLTRSIAQLSVRVRDVMHRLDGPVPPPAPAPGEPDLGGEPDALIDVASLTVTADGDLGGLDRQLQHVVHRVEEVTERLQRQHWDMLRAEQLVSVGRLAAGVAHEVRNPLTGMKLLVEAALRPRNRKPLTEEDLRVIHGEIAGLEETVQNFLTYARPPALQRQPCDLREVLGRSAELVRTRARQQGVEVAVHLPERPVELSLDAGQFNMVLVNLFLNALDAMPRGGRLGVEVCVDEGLCRLQVHDTGPGIAAGMVGRLFTPFASTKATGTGLGLSLSRRIVEEHGGRISAANRPENGACFTIVLPLERALNSQRSARIGTATHPAPGPQPASCRPPRVDG